MAEKYPIRVVAYYAHNTSLERFREKWNKELNQVLDVIGEVRAERSKESKEKNREGEMLYSPEVLNESFKQSFRKRGWTSERLSVPELSDLLKKGVGFWQDIPKDLQKLYLESRGNRGNKGYREIDFVSPSRKVGVEVQFGKYAFMIYNVLAKMTVFHRLLGIEAGIEIVPMHRMASEMSSGVSTFEQLVGDLHMRGVSDLDIPVLVLGIDVVETEVVR